MNQNLNLNYYEKRSNIATTLSKKIKALSKKPMTKGEIELAMRNFIETMNCLAKMNERLLREGCHIDKSIDEGARGRAQLARPKYAPVRIC